MKTVTLTLFAILLIPIASADACSRRCQCRKARRSVSYARPIPPTAIPLSLGVPTYPSIPSLQAPAMAPAQVYAPAAQPTYQYEASPGGPPAYYYAYNDNGELVVKQWMDWLFRGGRAAGMPAPPLPVVGRLFRP